MLYSPSFLEKLSEKLGHVSGIALRAPKRDLSSHLTLRIPAKFALGALLKPLFGQFLEKLFGKSQALAKRLTISRVIAA
jgi:hypothetical protein